ncbi:MAG: alpha-L-fucosidase [Butyricimonas faecalis]
MLTAKHHDGFCLWPTKTTRHASRPLRGKRERRCGRELKKACDRNRMKFRIYLSF